MLALREADARSRRSCWRIALPDGPRAEDFSEVPASTPESTALAKDAEAPGFRFVGPTTAYALQQAVGHVNDHLAGCIVRDDVEAERRRAFGR